MKRTTLTLLALLLSVPVLAQSAFGGPDYSGVYDCTGNDAHEGAYTGIVTLQLDTAQSTGEYGAYKFSLQVPDFGTYQGMAVTQGEKLAIYFSLPEQANGDYGVGIATIQRGVDGKVSFRKFYYEPAYKGGNTGSEDCVLRK